MENYDCLIRTYNSERTIKDVLKKINDQTFKPKSFIFIDNNSKDYTKEILRKEKKGVLIHYPYRIFNYSKAINLGLDYLKSEYTLIISSHTIIFNNEALKKSLTLMNEYKDCIGITLSNKSFCKDGESTAIIDKNNFDGYNGIWNSSGLYRTELLKIRKFREDLPTCEDAEWSSYFLKNKNNLFTKKINPKIIHFFNAETYNKNPNCNNQTKRINEHISIAYYSNKKLLSLNSVLLHIKQIISQLIKLRFFTQEERSNLAFNFFVIPRLIKARFKKPIFESRYF